MTPDTVYHRTPSVRILDNRGLTVRNIEYYRHPDTPEATEERITHHHYNAGGFLTESADPRLSAAGSVNIAYLTDLTGSVLRTRSVDDGVSVALNDVASRPFLSLTGIALTASGTLDRQQVVVHRWEYENDTLPGRPLSATEQTAEGTLRVTDRFVWAGASADEQALNLAGQCISHYHTAGVDHIDRVALTGAPISVTQRLLKEADNPAVVADWQGADSSAWNDLLATESWTTLSTADATGAPLLTEDGAGNRQRVAYDVAGLLQGSWVTVKDGQEQTIVRSLTYSAAGQKQGEEHGNGVVTTYRYEPQTQRLTGIKTERPAGHPAGAKVFQDLQYEYDRVGNVVRIANTAEAAFYWNNQKVEPENTYDYDSLYQLVTATGREMAGIAQQNHVPSPATVPLPADNTVFTHYSRSYLYDPGGNLQQIRHSASASGNNYTLDITVSDRSNRAVLNTFTENPADVDGFFTAGGQQTAILPGQTINWTARGEVAQITLVTRAEGANDTESYRYDSNSQRLVKITRQITSNSEQIHRVYYLPGLELRTVATGDTETERMQVLCIGEAGRAQVRILHWESGKPADMNADQVRYSYDNLLGSSGLEVDGEGNLITQEEYYPYGGTAVWTARSQQEAAYKILRYSGKERDATGLYYYGYRYYQPWTGRWLSADPSGVSSGLNVYAFVNNNPLSFIDDIGLQPWPISEGLRAQIANRYRPYELRSGSDPVYQTALRKRHFWSNDQNSLGNRILMDKRINPFAESVTTQAQPEHDQLVASSVASGAVGRLKESERNIINLYSQESLPFHTITLGFRELNEQEKAQGYHMGQGVELINALAQLPPYHGKTYRGAFVEKGFTYATAGVPVTRSMTTATARDGDRRAWQVGDYVTTKTFFSTSAAKGVAAEFIMRQRFGSAFYADTAILNIEGSSGRNITELTHIKQAEVLYPAYTVFRVSEVQKGEFGLEIGLQEVGEEIWHNPKAVIRDYRYGAIVKQRPAHMIPHRAA